MIYFSDAEIDFYINEDIPYSDLTSFALEIDEKMKAQIIYVTREETVICGTEEVARMCEKLGLEVTSYIKSGTKLDPGTSFFEAQGGADAVHKIWRLGNIWLEYACGIATRTRKLVDLAKKVNPLANIVTTRKNMPFTKKLSIKAVLAGGGLPHRLGLSETILVFAEHIKFLGGIEGFIAKINKLKQMAPEKKITVEVHNIDDAIKLANAGIDILQLDKFSVEQTKEVIEKIKTINSNCKVAIAGGINPSNVQEYAQVGVVLMVTSWPYFGKPSDIKSKIESKK